MVDWLPVAIAFVHSITVERMCLFSALREPAYGRYPLNGDKKRENSREFIVVGARFEYISKYGFQSIKSRGPLRADLEIMVSS